MKVLIFQTGEPLHIDNNNSRPMRAINLTNMLVERGHQVTLFSSQFNHQKKIHRLNTNTHVSDNFKTILIPSPGYVKNVSISRLLDHFYLAINLQKALNQVEDLPDIAFVGFPPIEAAFVMTRWLRKKNIPSILDIKDQWPEVLIRSFSKFLLPILIFLALPYFWLTKKSIRNATGVSSISEAFLSWSRDFSNSSKRDIDKVFYLTSPNVNLTDEELASARLWWSKKGIIRDNTFRIIFVGSFSRAFDFDTIYKSAENLSNRNINCEFVLCGNGEFYKDLKHDAKNYSNIKIIDWIDESKIIALSKISSLYIAPYKNTDDFILSIPNKVIDSFRLSLPIISPLKGEVRKLINDNNVGIYYDDAENLSDSIISMVDDKKKLELISNNSKKLYNTKFEFNRVYDDFIDHLENMVEKNDK